MNDSMVILVPILLVSFLMGWSEADMPSAEQVDFSTPALAEVALPTLTLTPSSTGIPTPPASPTLASSATSTPSPTPSPVLTPSATLQSAVPQPPPSATATLTLSITNCLTTIQDGPPIGQSPQEIRVGQSNIIEFRYLLFIPKEYYAKPDEKWPTILFLHGMGERGNDLELVKKHGPPKIVEENNDFPFIVISPQCPPNEYWNPKKLNMFLDEVLKKYRIDQNRIYLTGLSMGGSGAWDLAIEYPERFAAIAPICGFGDPDRVCRIKDIPAWVFHGAKDDVIPIQRAEKMVNNLRKCGGNVIFTVYPEAYHDSWTETYNNPDLYDWFLKQKKQ